MGTPVEGLGCRKPQFTLFGVLLSPYPVLTLIIIPQNVDTGLTPLLVLTQTLSQNKPVGASPNLLGGEPGYNHEDLQIKT
jgi:hypothetical protein